MLLYHSWECKLMQPLWRAVWRFPEKIKKIALWSCNLTSRHISRENFDSKRYMHSNVHRSTIYNHQDIEATYMSINRWMDKENVYTFSMHTMQSVQSLSSVWLFATPWTAAGQASLSITNSWSLLKLMSIELWCHPAISAICCPLLLVPSIFASIRVFSSESALHIRWPKYWSFFQLQHQSFQWIFRVNFL